MKLGLEAHEGFPLRTPLRTELEVGWRMGWVELGAWSWAWTQARIRIRLGTKLFQS